MSTHLAYYTDCRALNIEQILTAALVKRLIAFLECPSGCLIGEGLRVALKEVAGIA